MTSTLTGSGGEFPPPLKELIELAARRGAPTGLVFAGEFRTSWACSRRLELAPSLAERCSPFLSRWPAFHPKSPCWGVDSLCRPAKRVTSTCRVVGKDGQLAARYDKITSSMWNLAGPATPTRIGNWFSPAPPYRRLSMWPRALQGGLVNLLRLRFRSS